MTGKYFDFTFAVCGHLVNVADMLEYVTKLINMRRGISSSEVRTLCELVNNAWVPITSSQNAGGFAKAETHWSIKLAQNALFEAISDPSLTSFENCIGLYEAAIGQIHV